MSSSQHDRELARRLLSGRPGPSRAEKEDILDGVLARVAPEPAPKRRLWLGALAASAGLAAAIFVLRPASPQLAARGGGPTPVLRLRCGEALDATCRAGDRLRFEVLGEAPARYLAAFARRADGTVIWYFPDEATRSLDLQHDVQERFLDRQIVLGADHPPGRYQVTAIFSARPLDRAEVRATLDAVPDGVIIRRLELLVR